MWRRIAGIILLVFGIVILAAELFSIINLDYYLVFNPAFILFRIVIAIVLIWLGIKLQKAHNEQEEDDETDDWEGWQ